MKKLRKGDPVIVIAGKAKGSVSVIEALDGDMVTVKDVNVVNVAYYLADQKKATKIGIELAKDGKKVRKAKVTGKVID